MLTPTFNITQNDEHLFVKIHAPYTHLKDVEIDVFESVLWFYSSPYFLRLHFPCGVVDDDEPPTRFDSDKGEFEIKIRKEQVGQHFPDLDLLSTLLAPKKTQQNIKPSIEVISGDLEDENEEEDIDEWLYKQELPQSEPANLLNTPKYGFGNLTSGVFTQVKTEFKEIIDLPNPDNTPVSQRDDLRIAEENSKFSHDHYLADFMEPEILQEYLDYSPPWCNEKEVKLSSKERECLKNLGNKEFLLSKEDKPAVWFSLVDLVFAFAYNHRTNLGENSVESAWTINKLSSTLSWFANFTSLESVVVTCIRRSLVYPLFRNWDLAQAVLRDTLAIFKQGRRRVLKCLLDIHSLFNASEPRYLLNQLYITDYCIWLQKASEKKFVKFTEALEKLKISKRDIGFDLEELEQAALIVQEEEEESLAKEFEKLKLENCNDRLTSSDESSDSESSTSTDGDSSSLDSDDDSSPSN